MKLGVLTAFAHNVAASLASGVSFMIGIWGSNVFRDASAGDPGHIIVDFLTGTTSGSPASPELAASVREFASRLPELARRHGIEPGEIRQLSARYGTDRTRGPHFTVTVATTDGKESIDDYIGYEGRRRRPARRTIPPKFSGGEAE